MEVILQIFLELFFQLFFEAIADAIWRRLPENARTVLKVIACAGLAVLAGWLSHLLIPTPFLKAEVLRVGYLVVGPLVVGLAMAWVGRQFNTRGKARSDLEHFGLGWLFAFLFALTRYLLTR